jgi:hypothetical protein
VIFNLQLPSVWPLLAASVHGSLPRVSKGGQEGWHGGWDHSQPGDGKDPQRSWGGFFPWAEGVRLLPLGTSWLRCPEYSPPL